MYVSERVYLFPCMCLCVCVCVYLFPCMCLCVSIRVFASVCFVSCLCVCLMPVICVAIDVCRRAVAIHEANVIHSDLKADNIMVDEQLEALLVDFGNAAFKGDVAGYLYTNARWIAPELCRAGPSTAASDAYSVGLLLQQISRHKRRGERMGDIAKKVRRPAPSERADLKDILAELTAWASSGEKACGTGTWVPRTRKIRRVNRKSHKTWYTPLPSASSYFRQQRYSFVAQESLSQSLRQEPPTPPLRFPSARNTFRDRRLFVQPQLFTAFRSAIEPRAPPGPALTGRPPQEVGRQLQVRADVPTMLPLGRRRRLLHGALRMRLTR